jgi:hypothetical protein
MKRTLIAAAIVASTVGLTACGSMTLDDGGRYDGYRATVLELATAAQETERIRILALSRLAETADDRTRDRIVSELQARPGQPVAGAQGIAAPAAPTHLGLEALRILGPGAIGLIGQGIGAWAQNQADILATQRHIENNVLINNTVQGALDANTSLGQSAFGAAASAHSIAGQALGTANTALSKVPTPAEPAPAEPTTE